MANRRSIQVRKPADNIHSEDDRDIGAVIRIFCNYAYAQDTVSESNKKNTAFTSDENMEQNSDAIRRWHGRSNGHRTNQPNSPSCKRKIEKLGLRTIILNKIVQAE